MGQSVSRFFNLRRHVDAIDRSILSVVSGGGRMIGRVLSSHTNAGGPADRLTLLLPVSPIAGQPAFGYPAS
jgi:hypothetical protein